MKDFIEFGRENKVGPIEIPKPTMKTWRLMNTMTFPARCSTGSGEMFDGLEQSDDEIEMESSVADAELVIRDEEFRWQRVEKLCEDVKQFGEEMIEDGSLASIYDFRIDKFQFWRCSLGFSRWEDCA